MLFRDETATLGGLAALSVEIPVSSLVPLGPPSSPDCRGADPQRALRHLLSYMHHGGVGCRLRVETALTTTGHGCDRDCIYARRESWLDRRARFFTLPRHHSGCVSLRLLASMPPRTLLTLTALGATAKLVSTATPNNWCAYRARTLARPATRTRSASHTTAWRMARAA